MGEEDGEDGEGKREGVGSGGGRVGTMLFEYVDKWRQESSRISLWHAVKQKDLKHTQETSGRLSGSRSKKEDRS